MKNRTKCLLTVTAATLAGIYAYNKVVEDTATKRNLLKEEHGSFYNWKEGAIFYTKIGSGSPVLLVHDINAASSSEEWIKVTKRLAKKHTVYAMDLIGCGRSDKPAIKYTNFLYVQLISSFVQDIIKEKTDVVATNISATSVILANQLNKDLFNKIILINPASMMEMAMIPDQFSKVRQAIIQLPIIGTFIYNLRMNPVRMDLRFKTKYYSKPQLVSDKLKDIYYESAHLDHSNGKFLYASLISKYVNMNIKHAVKKIDKPVYIIGSRNLKGNVSTLDLYHKMNTQFEITHISNGNLYPQMEVPEKVSSIINSIID